MLSKKNKKTAFMPFITAGFPNIEKNLEYIKVLIENGADVLEIGIPYSDPLADGEIIQNSSKVSLDNGFKIKDLFLILDKIRKFSDIEIVIMVYINSILSYGEKKFAIKLKKYGINYVIVPDLPIEERKLIEADFNVNNLNLISMIAPTSKERIKNIVASSKGFLYVVSSNGLTGDNKMNGDMIKEMLSDIYLETELPIALGFGINTKEHVIEFKEYCNGIIIGSAIIDKINKCELIEDKYPLIKFLNEINVAINN